MILASMDATSIEPAMREHTCAFRKASAEQLITSVSSVPETTCAPETTPMVDFIRHSLIVFLNSTAESAIE